MRIINLVENTEGASGCGCEHGLSFYIETENHKLLVDTGASDLLLKNAEKLGIDLTKVDTVVLSHGHYDHGGGILPFAEINPEAKIYIPESAFEEYYSMRDGAPRYIGLAEEIRKLPQVVIVGGGTAAAAEPPAETEEQAAKAETQVPAGTTGGIYRIDDELSLFSGIGNEHPIPSANRSLRVKTEDGLIQDDFRHEQCLVISEGDRKVLLSGCAHHGILNVLDRYRELYGGEPDAAISGFHMMKKNGYSDDDINTIINTALELEKYGTVFYTGHCTGIEPYEAMKKLMDDQLRYVHSGDEIMISDGGCDRVTREALEPEKATAAVEAERAANVEAETAAAVEAERAANAEAETAEAAEADPETAGEPEPEPTVQAEPETAVEPEPELIAEAEPETPVKTSTGTTASKETKKAPQTAAKKTSKKSHKLVAGAAAALFVITMVTGLKRK